MNGRAPSFIGSPNTSASGSRGQYFNCIHELDDKQAEIEDDNDQPLSTQGDTPPWAQPETPQSVRSPSDPPGPQDFVIPRAPQGIATLEPVNPFATIQNPRKHKVHTEVFSAFTGRPRGNDPNHIKLCEAGLAMAKRVFHPPEAERWPSAEASAFMKKYMTLVSDKKMNLESDLYLQPFLKEHEKNPSYK